jgi:uncharacterized protein YbjT (DUF2867 family)
MRGKVLIVGATARVGRELLRLLVAKGELVRAAAPLIDTAKKRKASLIVNLTEMGVEQDEMFMLRILEKYLEASGIPFVHLRPNWFM